MGDIFGLISLNNIKVNLKREQTPKIVKDIMVNKLDYFLNVSCIIYCYFYKFIATVLNLA